MSKVPLNKGKNTHRLKAYHPFYAAPDFQIHTIPRLSQTSQSPPLNPDNKKSPSEKNFLRNPKECLFFNHGNNKRFCLL